MFRGLIIDEPVVPVKSKVWLGEDVVEALREANVVFVGGPEVQGESRPPVLY